MSKTENDNHFLWSGVTGGLGSLLVFFVGGNLPIAVASGAALFAAGAVLFKKPKQPEVTVVPTMDDASLLAKGREGVKNMHALVATIDDDKMKRNADEVA